MKTIIVAHGHPTLHKGGGEVAAYSLHRMLRAEGHQSVFVGWGGQASSANGGSLTLIGEDDYLLFTESEHFRFSSTSPNLPEAFAVLMEAYQPDVIHFHHYLHIGIEAAALIKKLRPSAKVVLTLHEYLAICANNGQLFTKTNEICTGYAPERCSVKCFPHIKPAAFFMREIAIKSALGFVDQFVSPSIFLAEQYIAWGIPKSRMSVIENPLLNYSNLNESNISPVKKSRSQLKLGFFGQINFYKGLDIVVEGVKQARENGVDVILGVHGNFSDVTGEAYVENLKSSLDELGSAVTYRGSYAHSDVQVLMVMYDFIIMGSRWFENSPVVIQEAICTGVPLIIPGHGGMAEKAAGVGITYRPGSASDLASVIGRIDKHKINVLQKNVQSMAAAASINNKRNLDKILMLYN